MEALRALRDHIGWNLHWRWDASESEFRLTLWEPDRTNTTAAWTFGQDDYYAVHRVGLDDDGIRTTWETVYLDTDGVEQSESATDTVSEGIYDRRFARIDARGTSVVTQAQAQALNAAALSDTSIPPLPQQIECALFWPAELGDLYAFSPNREYDTEQKAAVFAYQHILTPDKCRTLFTLSGKPSGGYARWHGVAEASFTELAAGAILHTDNSVRSHTGDTFFTVLATVKVPALHPGRKISVRGGFRGTGSGGNKAFAITYTEAVSNFYEAFSDEEMEFEFIIHATGLNEVTGTTVRQPSVVSTTIDTVTSDLDESHEVVFAVTLDDAADTAVLRLSQVTWLGAD
jgi:hypothetical protein